MWFVSTARCPGFAIAEQIQLEVGMASW